MAEQEASAGGREDVSGATVPEEAGATRRLAILLAMAMFVLVVDTSVMNVSISAVVLLTAGLVVLIPIVPRASSGWYLVVPLVIAGSRRLSTLRRTATAVSGWRTHDRPDGRPADSRLNVGISVKGAGHAPDG